MVFSKNNDDSDSDDFVVDEAATGGISLSRPDVSEPEIEKTSSRKSKRASSKSGLSSLRKPRRPGDQEITQSPLVASLGGISIALLLLAAIIYFIIGRNASNQDYLAAENEFKAGHFRQAKELYLYFLEHHSTDSRVETAGWQLGRSRILSEIGGASPAWANGLTELESFIKVNRDKPTFSELHPEVVKYSSQIASGAGKDAMQSANNGQAARGRELLTTAIDAGKIMGRYVEKSPDTEKQQIDLAQLFDNAEAAIRRQETFDTAIAEVRGAIESQNPAVALQARRKLLTRYSDFGQNKELKKLLAQTLETERSSIQREETQRAAITPAENANQPTYLALAPHTRSRSEEASQGRTVVALAKGSCWGIDSVTGRIEWRHVVGEGTPFFPVSVSTSVPAVLMYDVADQELLLVNRNKGDLIWRQPIGAEIVGGPLVQGGMIYLPTLEKKLYQISAETGEVTAQLTFSQKVLGPPVLEANNQQMVLAGDEGVLYRILIPSMEPKSVTYLGHSAGSIKAPLMSMGALILVIERDRSDSTLLRVLDTRISDDVLTEVATARVDGAVRDEPILRGKQLFVAASDERLAAFTVSDDANLPALSDGPRFQVPGLHDGPVYLSAGPNGQLWMSSSSLRRFQLKANNFELDTRQLAVGYSTQPVQAIGQEVYTGYKVPYADAVFFEQSDREEMVSRWRTVLGASTIVWGAPSDGGAVCVNETGAVFLVTPEAVTGKKYLSEAASQLKIEAPLSTPLQGSVLDGNRICAYIAGKTPTFWEINRIGRVDQQVSLPAAIEAPPTTLGDAIILPLPQRLKVIGAIAGNAKIEDFQTTTGPDVKARWKFVVSAGDSYLFAGDDQNMLTSIQFRQEPMPYLAKLGERKLENPVDVAPVAWKEHLCIADSTGHLELVDVSGLQAIAQVELGEPTSNALWVVGSQLFAESGQNQLHCLNPDDELKTVWKWDMGESKSSLAGAPLQVGSRLIVAQQNGQVTFLNPQTGEVQKELQLDQYASSGPRQIGDKVFVPAMDGTLQNVSLED